MNVILTAPERVSRAVAVLREVEYLLPKVIATGIALVVILTLLVLILRQRKRIRSQQK